jgi:hypothetical protein
MLPRVLIALILAGAPAPPADTIADALARLSEEAEAFALIAPQVLSQETCRQKAAKGRRGLHFSAAPAPGTPPQLSFRVREITSEYGFAAWQDSKDGLHEFRRVISVDGRPIETVAEARRKLSLALTDPGDRERRRLLRDFERWGLDGAVTDFGQSILLFVRRRLADYQFKPGESGRIGPDQAHAIDFRQSGGAQAFRIFDRGDQVVRQPLEGRIWVRDSDSLPLRIELRSARKQQNSSLVDVAAIDYAMSAHGALLPASVLHRQFVDERMVVENSLQYSAFRRFAASAEIKFTEIDEPPPRK